MPAIDERSARTVVELREGQTLAIAGLLQLLSNNVTTRVPGLGELPIVGPWFSNNSLQTIETETIILVTPELVAPLDKNEVTEAPGDRVYQPNDAEFYLLGRIEGKLGREFRATKAEQDPLNLMKHFPERAAVGCRPARLCGLSHGPSLRSMEIPARREKVDRNKMTVTRCGRRTAITRVECRVFRGSRSC